MKTLQKSTLTCLAVCGLASIANAVDVAVDPNSPWQGFMNVFETPQHGGGYVFGSGWGTADLCATFSGPVLTLSPNTVNDPNPFWYSPSGGPGSVGNKSMDASMYVERTGVYVGQTLNFQGTVTANTLFGQVNQLGNGWTSVAFIKDFASDYSSFTSVTAPLNVGNFNISLLTSVDPTHHIQYGFETIGPDVWSTDVGPYGNIQVVPEPSSLALLGFGAFGALCAWRRRK
jgi:hypothetical protein